MCRLTSSVNGFAELPATIVSELGCHVGNNLKRVGFELYIYIYIYIYVYIYIYTYTEFAWLSGGPLQCKILSTPLSW